MYNRCQDCKTIWNSFEGSDVKWPWNLFTLHREWIVFLIRKHHLETNSHKISLISGEKRILNTGRHEIVK